MLNKADFKEMKTIDEFDFSLNKNMSREDIYNFAAGEFIRQEKDLLMIEPPETEKSHLAQAIGYSAINLNFSVYYRSIFDLVRDFSRQEKGVEPDKILNRYLVTDLLIYLFADMGIKQLGPKHLSLYSR